MKRSVLLLFVLLLSAQLFAQITLERSDYTLTTDGATINSWLLSSAGFSLPAEGADVVWDFGQLSLTSSYDFTKTPVSEPLFPDANLVEMSSGLALNLVEQGVNFYEELADDGHKVWGRTTEALDVPLVTITGGANDTMNLLGSVSQYQEPLYYVKFPLNFEDSWDTEVNIVGNYLMTVQIFGLDHVPASSIYNYVETNSVSGYGTLILPNPDGTGTVSMEALLLKSSSVRTDSFFLAGQPAPQVMLDALGVTQGSTSTRTHYSFYAKGLNRSALVIELENGQVSFLSMADDVKNIISSTRQQATDQIQAEVFPNPTTGKFQVVFEKSDGQAWSLDLYDGQGRLVQRATVDAPVGAVNVRVALPADLQAGMYRWVLRNADGALRAGGSLVVE